MLTAIITPEDALPLRVGDVRIELAGSEGDQVQLRVIVFEGDEPRSVVEQGLSWSALELTRAAELEQRARARLKRYDAALLMPRELLRAPRPYRRVGPFYEPDARLWHSAVVNAIHEQALERGFASRYEAIEDWPVAAFTAYFLWLAAAMLGGNGLEVFLSQAPVEDVVGVLEALETARCDQLAQRYREALGLAHSERAAEFLLSVDEDWLEEHMATPEPGATWSSIDHWEPGGTYSLIKHELQAASFAYVRAHAERLVARAALLG